MTRTDQAFIQAYQRAERPAPPVTTSAPPTPVEGGVAYQRTSARHGPHAAFGAAAATQRRARAPLSEVIAERMRHAAAGILPTPTPDCGTQVGAFRWPPIVASLAGRHHEQYLDLVAAAVTLSETNASAAGAVLGVAGVQPGSGASTTVLAIARSLAPQHGPVAIVDADTAGSRLAASLGVLKAPPLAHVAAAGGRAGEAVVHAVEDGVSLVVAGRFDPAHAQRGRELTAKIATQHALTLIDFGPLAPQTMAATQPVTVAEGPLSVAIEALRPAGVVIVRRESDLAAAVGDAQQAVLAAGAAPVGVVANRVGTL
ncbi:MAG: hypothetical protein AAF790_03260 [Planctomycetota bacterium]